MAALSKRDIEMIFRAETDAATRPVNELTSDVKTLRRTLEDLTKSSDKTDKSLDALTATTRDLEKAQEELGTARTLLTQLNSQASALDRAEQKADAAAKKYADLKTQVDGMENPNKRLRTSLEAAERGMNASNQRLDEARKNYAEVKSQIEGIIGPVDNLQNAFRQVATTQRDVSQGLAVAKDAVSEFRQEIAAANAAASGDNNFANLAAKSPLSSNAIAEISQYENRVELLRLEEQALEAQRKGDAAAESARKQKQRDDVEALLRGNQALEKEIQDVAAAAQRASELNAYRTLATDALAAKTSAEVMGQALNEAANSGTRLAGSIRGLSDPAKDARFQLEGVEKSVDAANAALSGGKITTAKWGELYNSLTQVQATLHGIAQAVDAYTAQETKVAKISAEYDAQAAKVRNLAQAMQTADVGVEAMADDLVRQEAALERLGTTLARETQRLDTFDRALKAVGVDSKAIPAAIDRIEGAARKAAPAIQKVSDAVQPGGKGGFLGLKPYELQNLGYQINDVFTSLGSGAPPMQVFAQQAGQILQIFPGIFTTIAANLPLIGLLGGAFLTAAAAISEANTQLEIARNGATLVARLGETGDATAKTYADLTQRFRDFGASADEAQEAATTLIEQGLNPAAYEDFTIAATNLASVTGTDLKTATEEVTKAFTAGADEVLKLDDKYHFLTDTQRDQLQASKDTKDETNEVNKAFTQLFKKMQDGANAQRTEYKDAVDTLRGAWNDFLGVLADTGVVDGMSKALANLVRGAAVAINLLREFNKQREANTPRSVREFVFGIDPARQDNRTFSQLVDSAVADTAAQVNRAQARFTQAATAPAGTDYGLGSRGRQGEKEEQDKKDRKEAEKAAKKAARDAAADAKRRQREAEQLARQYENEQDQLTSSLSRFTAEALKGTSAPLEAQLANARQAVDEQFKALEDRLAEFRSKFGSNAKINGMSQADYAASLAAQKQQITLNRQMAVYESNVNDLLKERDTRLKSIREEQAAGLLTAQQALDKTREVTSDMGPKIDAAITAARNFIAALSPSAETQALLARFDLIGKQSGASGSGTIDRKAAVTAYAAEEQKLNDIIDRRTALIEAQNRLYDMGAITYTQKEEAIKTAYQATTAELQRQVQVMQQYLMANQALFNPEQWAALQANLQAVGAQAKYVSEQTAAIKTAAQNAIAGGLTNMFDTLAQGIANAITGAGSFKDILSDLGNAALSFAATFTKAIADAIIQLYALRIAKALVGGFHGGGEVGSYANGQMMLSRDIGFPSLAGVPRYHNGTQGAGLKSNEMLAVLEKGEKVQTEEQQHMEAQRLKNARAGRKDTGLRQVLAIGDGEIAAAMSGAAGEDTIMTHLSRNITTLKQWIGK